MNNTVGNVKTFNCPNCGGTVNVRAAGISITAVCQYCSSVIDLANENIKLLNQLNGKLRKPILAIGSRGILFDTEWEVIGYMVRGTKHDKTLYTWEEYLLFNPWQGFRFLVQSDGHWSFIKTIHQQIKEIKNGVLNKQIECEGENYRAFFRGGVKVIYVIGEFYWRVKVDEMTIVTDYVSPPYIISKEENDDEMIWSKGIYVEKEVIKQAFKLPSLAKPMGVGANQPSPVPKISKTLLILTISFITLLLIQYYGVEKLAENKIILSKTIQASPQQRDQVILSEPIELTGNKGNIEISVNSSINNNWLELESTLINDESQEVFNTLQTVEYYYGSDEEGSWSEGSQQDQQIISAVPAGKYHLSLIANSGTYEQFLPVDFTVTVKRNVANSSNFFIALLALLLFPIIMIFRHFSFERHRWENSNYTPAIYKVSED